MTVHTADIAKISLRSSSSPIHIWPEEPVREEGFTTLSAVIECGGAERRRLWYRLPEEYQPFLSESCDPFIIGLIFMAMESRQPVRVHGQVSPVLLDNLAEFQIAWERWRPTRYGVVEIIADAEREQIATEQCELALCAFTGGIDSAFTIYRHKKQECGRLSKDVEAGLFVHGFDIPLSDADAFARASARAEQTLSSIDTRLITLATNHKELNPDWNFTHGAGIASCLSLLSGRYRYGVLGATYTYAYMNKSWGSHPLTDRLFSSGSFQIIHDAAQYRRDTKLKKLEQWPQAFRNLRVCWSAPRKDENCGRCIKCILTALAALSRLLPLPESFPQEPTEHALLQLRDLDDEHTDLLERILKHPNSSNLPARLLHAIERCTKYNRRRLELEKPAKNQIAKRVRSFALGLHDWRGP